MSSFTNLFPQVTQKLILSCRFHHSVIGSAFWEVQHKIATTSSKYESDTKSCIDPSTELKFPAKENPQSSIAIEFKNLNIPTNSTIQDAKLTFHASQMSLDDSATLEISIASSGVSNNFVSNCLHKDTGNEAILQPVIWQIGQWTSGSVYSSPNISHLIQYLISYSSWNDKSSVILIIRPSVDLTIGSARHAYSHNDGTRKPTLTLYYTNQNPGK